MDKKTEKKKSPFKIVVILIIAIVIIAVSLGGYFLYKYLFPTKKELFVVSHINTIERLDETEEPERFKSTTNVSFKTEGDFTSKKAQKELESASLLIDNTQFSDDASEFNLALNILGDTFLTAHLVKNDDIEVFSVPQLSEKSYGAESYEDVLALLMGAERPADIDILENVDEVGLKRYFSKYAKEIYNSVPDESFTLTEDGDYKTISFDADLNRTFYSTMTEIKADTEFCSFLYEQEKIIKNNLNRKYPYMGTLFEVLDEDEYKENYKEKIDEFIKSVENSRIIVTAKIDERRQIIEESILITDDGDLKTNIFVSRDKILYENYKDGVLMLKINSDAKKDETTETKKTEITFDINEYTKEQTAGQKLIILTIDSATDTNVSGGVKLPENYEDIRKMSDDEKSEITSTASEKFISLLASVTLGILS